LNLNCNERGELGLTAIGVGPGHVTSKGAGTSTLEALMIWLVMLVAVNVIGALVDEYDRN
jgi:hypothetical protein